MSQTGHEAAASESAPHETLGTDTRQRKSGLKTVWILLKSTIVNWLSDDAQRLAAALAYYTMFALAPLLVIVIGLGSIYFGTEQAQLELILQARGLVGVEGAKLLEQMIESSLRERQGWTSTLIGLVTLLAGASGAFAQLQAALNVVWGVKPNPDAGWLVIVRTRFFSFAMLLVVGFLLLVSLVISAWLAALNNTLNRMFPDMQFLFQGLNLVVSFGLVTLLFASIYKVLPDVQIHWRDIWVGAVMTALLFTLGKFAIGLYLGNSAIGSSFGTAGALVVLLIWVYYSAQIFLLGAEFIQVYANWRGARITPADHAVAVE